MNVELSDKAQRQVKKLPKNIRQKLYKQLDLLLDNPKHPSLGIKKMTNSPLFEGRIDYHYRFTYFKEGDTIYIGSVGIHDTGLGKK